MKDLLFELQVKNYEKVHKNLSELDSDAMTDELWFGRGVAALVALAKATYKKMVQNLWWATGYNAVAIPLAAGVLYTYGIILNPALGAGLMSLSTVIVAVNARLLKLDK